MKKVHLLAFAACFFFAACNDGGTKSETTTTDTTAASSGKMTQEDKEERNKKIVMESVEAINTHNADNVLKNASADVIDYGEGSMAAVKGVDSIKVGMNAFLTAFPDYKASDLTAVADGDHVMVYGEWTGTFKNDYMGMKATNKSFKVKDVDIFTVNDEGKITSHRSITPWSVIMMQVGAKPAK